MTSQTVTRHSATRTMRAAVIHAHHTPLSVQDVPIPAPGPGEVLIEVIACGVCHSDVHAADGDWDPPPALPLIPGHEVTGRVVGRGSGVGDELAAVGDLVGVPWMFSACGACDYCLAGMETICPAAEATGYSTAGGYAEFMVAPAAFVARLPEACDPLAIAPILCAGVTSYRGLKRTGARPGQWVAVIGVGGLGHLAIQYALAMGLRVVAVDIADDKLAHARTLGAELAVNAATADPGTTIHREIGGVHGAVVAASATRPFEQAVTMLRPAGTAVYLGIPGGEANDMRLSISSLINTELTLRGSSVGTRHDLAEAIDFAVRGRVAAAVSVAALDDVNDVLDNLRAGRIVGRTVLDLRR